MSKKISKSVADRFSFFFAGGEYRKTSGDIATVYEIKSVIRTKINGEWMLFIIYGSDDLGDFSREMNSFLVEFEQVPQC